MKSVVLFPELNYAAKFGTCASCTTYKNPNWIGHMKLGVLHVINTKFCPNSFIKFRDDTSSGLQFVVHSLPTLHSKNAENKAKLCGRL